MSPVNVVDLLVEVSWRSTSVPRNTESYVKAAAAIRNTYMPENYQRNQARR